MAAYQERSRIDLIAPAAVGVALLAAYLRTMARTAIAGDSAELITTVHTLGILHPTGYPLFAMVAKLFDLLAPIGTVAFRLNLFATLMGAATGVVVAWAYRSSGGARPAAALAGLAAGLFFVPWEQALNFEVYTMHTLLCALALLAFLRWRSAPTPRRLAVLAGLGGLALSHHGTAMFVVVPLFAAALALHRPLTPRLVAKCAAWALLPFVAYAYLPLDSLRDPYVRWGDASTLSAFWDHVTGKMFQSYLGSHGAERMEPPELLRWLGGGLRFQLTLAGALLLAAGWAAWWRRDRAFWACTTAAVALSLLWVSVYRVLDQEVFVIACFTIFGFWLAAGAEAVAGWVARFAPAARWWAMGALLVAIPVRLAAVNLPRVDLSRDWSLYDEMRLILRYAGPKAIIILRGHAFHSTALYLQQCEGIRPDAAVVSSGLSSYGWYVSKHTDPIVVEAIRQAVPALRSGAIADPQLNWCPYLTTLVARLALPGRPVYVNQHFAVPPGYFLLAGPPIEEVTMTRPDLTARDRGAETVKARFPLGVALLEARPEPRRVRPGGFFEMRFGWRCAQPLREPVNVEVVFVREGSQPLLTEDALRYLFTRDERWLPREARNRVQRVAFAEAHALLHGLLPLEANAPGYHYQRSAPYAAPTGISPGRYRIYVTARSFEQRGEPFEAGELVVIAGTGG